jgi:2-oxoglutarate ferredoxin oxidoreductase subunit beta
MRELGTDAENTWCPGCGNFGILRAVKKAAGLLDASAFDLDTLVMSSGIGCHGKIFDYLDLSGVYSLHGRAIATVTGMKMANPLLHPLAFVGDGDAYGEGLAHLLFAAKRNMDITVLVHDNGVYGLTTGQFTPTTERGVTTRSSPHGNVEEPFNPLLLMLDAGASFVARGYPGKLDHLADLIARAIEHVGFSFIDVLQPCVTFHDTYEEYNRRVEVLDATLNMAGARELALQHDALHIGVFYHETAVPYHERLLGDFNPVEDAPSRDERLAAVEDLSR